MTIVLVGNPVLSGESHPILSRHTEPQGWRLARSVGDGRLEAAFLTLGGHWSVPQVPRQQATEGDSCSEWTGRWPKTSKNPMTMTNIQTNT